MRILHLMNWFNEGMGYQENYLPFYQAELGNHVCMFCSKYFLKKRKIFKNINMDVAYSDLPLKIKRLDSIYIQYITEQNWYLNLRKEVENFSPEIVHLDDIWALPSIQLLLTKFVNKEKTKIFIDSHIDNGNFNFRAPHKYIYYFWLIKKIVIPAMFKQNFKFLAVNPYAQYYLKQYFGIPRDRIMPLFLGIDSKNIYFSQIERYKLREKHGINKDGIVFAFSGVFEQSKSLDVLITAFKNLFKKYKNIFLLIIGKGDLPRDSEFELLRKKGIIIITGWLSRAELCRWYSVADVGVLPGKLGGIRDILAAGRPLIVNNDLAVSYLVEYNNGQVFTRGKIEELVSVMEGYIQNPDLIYKHGRQSLRLVDEKLSWRNIALESLNIYKNSD